MTPVALHFVVCNTHGYAGLGPCPTCAPSAVAATSETPRTDAAISTWAVVNGVPTLMVTAEFASRLERDLNEMRYVAANPHCIAKVHEQLGPMSLWTAKGLQEHIDAKVKLAPSSAPAKAPVEMLLFCPRCQKQHVDEPKGEWTNPPHATHTCQFCGLLWRPSNENTTGVAGIKALEEKHVERIYATYPLSAAPAARETSPASFALPVRYGTRHAAGVRWFFDADNREISWERIVLALNGTASEAEEMLPEVEPPSSMERTMPRASKGFNVIDEYHRLLVREREKAYGRPCSVPLPNDAEKAALVVLCARILEIGASSTVSATRALPAGVADLVEKLKRLQEEQADDGARQFELPEARRERMGRQGSRAAEIINTRFAICDAVVAEADSAAPR